MLVQSCPRHRRLTPSDVLGVGVVGLGVGEQHARAYVRHGRCVVRWVYDLDSGRMRQVLGALGQGRAADSFEQIVADPAVDVVSIASYDDHHFGQVMAALQARKHVFVEKPLCRSTAELRMIKQAWQASGCILASNLVLRAAPVYQWLRRAIDAGELGTLYAFDGDYLYGRLSKITEGWRKNVEAYSVMQGGGVHLVDLMLWLTGQKPTHVTAVGNRLCTTGTAFRYHDYVAATYRFPSGLVGRITANFGCVHRHQHVIRVFGTKATFLYDDQGPRLHASCDPDVSPTRLELATLPASKGDLVGGFVSAILNGDDSEADTQHEFAVISACVAADEALARGQQVEITYV